MSGPARSGPTTSAASCGAGARVALARRADLDQRHVGPAITGSPRAWRSSFRRPGVRGAPPPPGRRRHRPTARRPEDPATTRTSGPRGAHTAGSVGPKTATVGQPTAAARWVGPESLPTAARASEKSAAILGRGQSCARASRSRASAATSAPIAGGVGRSGQGDHRNGGVPEPFRQSGEARPRLGGASGARLQHDGLARPDPPGPEPGSRRGSIRRGDAKARVRPCRRQRSQGSQGLERVAGDVATRAGRRDSARHHHGAPEGRRGARGRSHPPPRTRTRWRRTPRRPRALARRAARRRADGARDRPRLAPRRPGPSRRRAPRAGT